MISLVCRDNPLILVVGVCASGKTTLRTGLKARGYNARSLAQEHSVSPRLWRRMQPDFLILLDCQFSTIQRRRDVKWGLDRYAQQKESLADAKENADVLVTTDGFTPQELVDHVESILNQNGIYPTDRGDHSDCNA